MKIFALILMLSTSSVWSKNLDYTYNQHSNISGSWSEVISIIAENFSPFEIKRCDVLFAFFADIGSPRYCCYDPKACEESDRFDEMPEFILKYRFQLNGRWRYEAPFSLIKTHINSGRPVIMYFKSPQKKHVVLVQGFENNGDVHVIDPLLDSPVRISYAELITNGYLGLKWDKSYTIGY